MNKVIQIPTEPGTPFGGGFYMGNLTIDGDACAIIAGQKAEGETRDKWIARYKNVPGAISLNDGMANTITMAEAGSKLAKWALGLHIGGQDDWYLPSQDELELLYRVAKPTADTNSLYMRSGINVSAIPPTYPYTTEAPAQTAIEAFKSGGTEAFSADWYWTSTQHAANSDSAWCQDFSHGYQDNDVKDCEFLARVVRRLKI